MRPASASGAGRLRVALVVLGAAGAAVGWLGTAAAAPTWLVALSAPHPAVSSAITVPQTLGVAAACSSLVGNKIVVSWTAVSFPSDVGGTTSYVVLQSSGSGYAPATGGTFSGPMWTSAGLALGTYTFEVEAVHGWTGPPSTATASHSVLLTVCT